MEKLLILLFLLLVLVISPLALGGYLYGTDQSGSQLYRIDPTDASKTLVGSAGWIDGLAYVPEPATLLLLGLGGLVLRRRK